MESFTLVDGAVALVVVMSGLLAYARGLTREILAIGGWIVAALVAFTFAGSAVPLVKQIPYVGTEYLKDNCQLSAIAAFALVFAITLVIASLFTPLFASLVQRSAAGRLDQALGFLFGIARGLLLVAVGFVLYDAVRDAKGIEQVDNSRSAAVFGDVAEKFKQEDPQQMLDWFTGQYEKLTLACTE